MSHEPVSYGKVVALIVGITGLGTGAIGGALSWHATSSHHPSAATSREVDNVNRRVDRVSERIDHRLERIEERQEEILRNLRTPPE
jgi:predicted neutral ceramidase superfamily lipid hydrolase